MNKKLNNLVNYLNKNNFYKEAKLLKEAMPIYFKDEKEYDKEGYESDDSYMFNTKDINEIMRSSFNKIKQDIEIINFFDNEELHRTSRLLEKSILQKLMKIIILKTQSNQNIYFHDRTHTDNFIVEKNVMLKAIEDLKIKLKDPETNIGIDKPKDIIEGALKTIYNKFKENDDPDKITFVYINELKEYDINPEWVIHDVIGHSLSQHFKSFENAFNEFFGKVIVGTGATKKHPKYDIEHETIISHLYSYHEDYLYSYDERDDHQSDTNHDDEMKNVNPMRDVFGINFISEDDRDAMMDIYISLIKNDIQPKLPDYIRNMGEDVVNSYHKMLEVISWTKVKLETGEALKELMGYYIFNFPNIQ